jgi:ketosteroid isomerase-like protein
MPSDIQDLAVAYGAAWAARDPDLVLTMHTADTVFHQHGVAAPAVGHDAVRSAIAALFVQIPDLSFDRRRVQFGTSHFVSEYEMSGTVEGHAFVVDGIDVFTLEDGLIARKDTYVDLAGLMRQVQPEAAVPTV